MMKSIAILLSLLFTSGAIAQTLPDPRFVTTWDNGGHIPLLTTLNTTCSTAQFVNGFTSGGVPTCATPTTGSSTAAAGSSGQFQTNSSGSLAGVTVSGAVSINGTTGVSTLAAGQAVANLGYTPANKAGDTFTGSVAFAPSSLSASVAPVVITQPSGSAGSNTVPSSNLGLQQTSTGTSSGWVPFWNGSGQSFNRVDASPGGAIGQGRIYSPVNIIWVDRVDNGVSDGSVNDPHSGAWGAHQPSNGISTKSAMYVEGTTGGGTGVHETVRINTIVDQTPQVWDVNENYVGIRNRTSILANLGGTTGSGFTGSKGAAFAYNPELYTTAAATNLLEAALLEGDISVNPAAPPRLLFGISMAKFDGAGSIEDAAYEVAAATSSTYTWHDALLITDVNGRFPINAAGSIVRVTANYNGGTPTFANGIDLSQATITNKVLATPKMNIDGPSGGVVTGVSTFGGLPTCNLANRGMRMFITDGAGSTFTAAAAGGGGNQVPVYCNSTAWVYG